MKSLARLAAAIFLLATPFCITGANAAETGRVGLVPADSKLLVVFANPIEGQDAGFNAWYDQHMRDFMKLPGFIRVQRFKMLSRKGRPDPEFKYLFLFEFKGDQDAAFAQTQAAMKDGRLQNPDGKVVGKVVGTNYGADGLGYLGTKPDAPIGK